jgi:hypothetical protein
MTACAADPAKNSRSKSHFVSFTEVSLRNPTSSINLRQCAPR